MNVKTRGREEKKGAAKEREDSAQKETAGKLGIIETTHVERSSRLYVAIATCALVLWNRRS
jgi:hypothetical protein